jgi:hypothetical protein
LSTGDVMPSGLTDASVRRLVWGPEPVTR